MGSTTYSLIVNSSNISEEHISEVQGKIKSQFKLQNNQLEKVFSGKPLRFIKNLDYKLAQHYCDAIEKSGLECQIESSSVNQEAPNTSSTKTSPVENKSAQLEAEKEKIKKKSITYLCPVCQVQQRSKKSCIHCKYNLAIYRGKMKEKNFIEINGKGYIPERRHWHRRGNAVRREMIRMGENADRRVVYERRKELGVWDNVL